MARRRSEYGWVELAQARILEVLGEQGACLRVELQARLGEAADAQGEHVDPHHVTTALRSLIDDGLVIEPPRLPTRGGRELPVLHLPVTAGNKRRIERA